MATIQERVAKGAAWFDRRVPEWDALIDISQLDMESYHSCIFGQLYGRYWTGKTNWGLSDTRVVALGLFPKKSDEYPELNAAWRDLIARRRASRLTPEPEAVAV